MKNIRKLILIHLIFIFAISCNIEPYEGDIPEEPIVLTCEEAIQNTSDAALVLANATSNNYLAACQAYKLALENQISFCGDADGSLQLVLNALGDCSVTEPQSTYWPMHIGNSWTYTRTITGFPNDEIKMEILDITDHLGNPSYRYDSFLGSAMSTDGTGFDNVNVEYFSRNDNGDYKVYVGEFTAELSGLYKITNSGYGYILLKDYVDIGAKWSDNFEVITSYNPLNGGATLPNVVTKYTVNMEILDKGISISTSTGNFNSVIKASFKQQVGIEGFPDSSSSADYVYYFAKDIGIVKVEGTLYDADSNVTSTVLQEIKSYVLN